MIALEQKKATMGRMQEDRLFLRSAGVLAGGSSELTPPEPEREGLSAPEQVRCPVLEHAAR